MPRPVPGPSTTRGPGPGRGGGSDLLQEPLGDGRQRQGLRLEIVEQQTLFDHAARDERGAVHQPWRIGERESPAVDGARAAQHGRPRPNRLRERVDVEHGLGDAGIIGRTYAGQHAQGARPGCLDHREAGIRAADVADDEREGKGGEGRMRHGAAYCYS